MLGIIGPMDQRHCGSRRTIEARAAERAEFHLLADGEALFVEGDRRRGAFRIRSGAVCHFMVWPDGHHDVLEFAFPGDIVGLGASPHYISSARALEETEVELISDAELDQALASDAQLANRLAAALDREFEYLKARALGVGARTPAQRLAAYIVAVAGMGCRTGEPVFTGIVGKGGDDQEVALANLLHLSPEELRSAVETITAHDLIEQTGSGLIVRDLDALRRLADS